MILVERGWTYSEEFRHQCEVRTIIRWRMEDRDRALRYLDGVKQRRGEKAGERLDRDVREQWKLGNRGKENEWKSESEKSAESSGKE